LLGEGSRIPARQLDTSIRLDSRFSNKLDSWGITAQLRLQF
jgi:fibronectin-binding autotransporter adhesin